MSNPTLINGFEDVLTFLSQQANLIKQLQEEKSAMKEALAEKFYKHYDDMGYDKLNIARTIGPDLGRMVDHLIEENKKLQEENKNLQDEEKALKEKDWQKPVGGYRIDMSGQIQKVYTQSPDKYDGDDWQWVYGKMIVDNEDEDTGEEWKDVVLCIAAGGDHWENWIMRPTMNYIENKDGLHPQHGKVLVQSSCGKYVSFQDKDYERDEDECICEYEFAVEETEEEESEEDEEDVDIEKLLKENEELKKKILAQ